MFVYVSTHHMRNIVFLSCQVAKQLTLDDLDEDALQSLAGGSFQLLPGKDMAGRGVGFIARKFSTFKTWKAGVSVSRCMGH